MILLHTIEKHQVQVETCKMECRVCGHYIFSLMISDSWCVSGRSANAQDACTVAQFSNTEEKVLC